MWGRDFDSYHFRPPRSTLSLQMGGSNWGAMWDHNEPTNEHCPKPIPIARNPKGVSPKNHNLNNSAGYDVIVYFRSEVIAKNRL